MLVKLKQRAIIDKLETLVHNRFSHESLSLKLSSIFGQEIKITDANDVTKDKDECDTSDWNLLFTVKDKEIDAYFDLYYLKMRKPSLDGYTMLITEISYEFE